MVFGTTYCGISHLPIKDGDNCMLMPLQFRMTYTFGEYNEPDINCFAYLYAFVAAPVEVRFEGNVAMIKYVHDMNRFNKAGDDYKAHSLFMLAHKEFYDKIMGYREELWQQAYMGSLRLFNTVAPIWEEAVTIEKNERNILSFKLAKQEITKEEYVEQTMKIPIPQWMKDVYKVADFMGNMGIPPHPIFSNDQQGGGKLYEQFRRECKSKECGTKLAD